MSYGPQLPEFKPHYDRVDSPGVCLKLLAAAMQLTPYDVERNLISISACPTREDFIKWLQSQPK